MSLRARVLAGLATVAVVLAASTFILISTTRGYLIGQIDDQLRAGADDGRTVQIGAHDERDEHEGSDDDHASPTPAPVGVDRYSSRYEGIIDPSGTLLTVYEPNVPGEEYSPPDVSASVVGTAPGTKNLFSITAVNGDVVYRVYAERLPAGTVFIAALPLADVDATTNRISIVAGLGLATIVGVLGAVGWWVVHLGIRPIKQMTATAAEIAAGDLSARVPEPRSPGTESGDLAQALNTMLAKIEHAVAEQARSEERLRRFVADASHELRTPITTIRGYAELYRHGGLAQPDNLDDAMRRTEQEAQRMGRLVEDMLTLAKLDEQRPLHRNRIDLSALVADAAADARVVAPDRVITARAPAGLEIDGDEDRLRQVIANIVGNAIVHTPSGTAISLDARRSPERDVTLDVTDEGPGMTADVAARITERFYRGDPSRSRERGGSGLGMSIVAAVVGAHGGTIDVESAPGEGTTVRLTLPASSAHVVTGTNEPPSA